MSAQQLKFIANCLRDLRFIQALALVASGQHESKASREYMNQIGQALRAVESEMMTCP